MSYEEDVREVVRKYSQELQHIYANRTKGDYTWEGLIWTLLCDVQELTIANYNYQPKRSPKEESK